VWAGEGVLLAQPQTYMNRSGWAVECLVDAHGVAPGRLLVAFDDVALPLGSLRLRPRGGPGGHRGLESVIDGLRSEEVARLRLGIAPAAEAAAGVDLADFVLAPFTASEEPAVEEMLARAVAAVETWREAGIEAAMNRHNG
jgi:PTH1 family peptidyl-tRNA hydrolase